MQLKVLSISARQPAWLLAGIAEYARRLGRFAQLEMRELKPPARSASVSVERLLEREATLLREQLPDRACCIALDVCGRRMSTEQFAQRLQTQSADGRTQVFLIGGPDGLHTTMLERAQLKLSLSDLTLPHGLARLLLVEQLYRACSWLAGHPYHRE